jgi:hypothetical protein
MRRLMLLVLAAIAVPAAVALAAAQQYNGTAGSGPNAGVEFGAKLAAGKPSVVRRFAYFNIPVTCGRSASAVSDRLPITMKVDARRAFHGSGKVASGATVTVKGTFARAYRKATGTLRITGSAPGCATVDSGVVRWTAKKVGH